MNSHDTNSISSPSTDPFEARLRVDLARLADYAPTSVDLTLTNNATVMPNDAVPRRGRRVAAVGAIVAVLAGGAGLTLNGLQSASDPGGAATPDEAVQRFADAFANEDLLGMADITVPEEAKALRSAAADAITQAKRLDLLSGAFRLDGLAGLNVQLDGLTLGDAPIDDNLVAVTTTGGTMAVTIDPAAMEVGDMTRSAVGDQFEVTEGTMDLASSPITFVAQRRGDQWYVSAGMSIAQNYVVRSDLQTPVDLGIVPEGSPSPEAAASAFYTRAANLDFNGAAAMVAPGEGDVFRRYAGLWAPSFDASIASARADGLAIAVTTPPKFETVSDDDGRVILKPVTYGFDVTAPEYNYTDVSQFDPSLPTIVSRFSKNGQYLLPAGQSVPASFDDPIFATLEFYSYDDQAAMDKLNSMSSDLNVAFEGDNNEIVLPTNQVQGDLKGVAVTHVEVADGCATITVPAGSENDLGYWGGQVQNTSSPNVEKMGENTYRECGISGDSLSSTLGLFAFGSSFGGSIVPTLPSIVVTNNDGEWFVSPIGTITESLVGPLREVPDDALLVDIPMIAGLSGVASRDQFNEWLVAEDSPAVSGELAPQCQPVVETGPDGNLVMVADPDISQLRSCVENFWAALDTSSSDTASSDVSEATASASAEVTGG